MKVEIYFSEKREDCSISVWNGENWENTSFSENRIDPNDTLEEVIDWLMETQEIERENIEVIER